MFCSKCGAQVENGDSFCSYCGNAIQQNASAYNAYQPAAYNYAVIKDGVNVVYPDGHSEIGDMTVSANEIVFLKKSKFVRVAFGFLGSSLEQGEEALRLPVSEIVHGQKIRYGLNPNVYQITMRNGQIFKLCVDHPKTITSLQQRFGQ